MEGIQSVFSWIGAHATKIAATLRAFFYMGTIVHWWTLTTDQLIAVMAFVEAFLYMFVESNTVSKVRVGERITEGVQKIMANPNDPNNPMNTTTGTGPSGGGTGGGLGVLVLVVVLGGGVLFAGCASGMHGAARTEDAAHDGLMAFDRMLDARCDASEITAPTCKELNSVLVHVWDLKNNLNRTIAGSASTLSLRLADFRAALQELIAKVNQLVQGGAKDMLLRELNLASTQTQ